MSKKNRLLTRLAIDKLKNRKIESCKKFFNGMYAEFSGLVFSETGYMDSSLFCSILEQAKEFLDGNVNREHKLYSLGKSFLEINKNKETHLALVKKILGDDWKSLRFRNLVRLGADIENVGLGTLSRPTLIGSLLYQKEKILGDKNGLPNSSDR